ncbi:C40 family peptidase [Paenibacillus sp. SYP-B3998]|uniref:C40 family peptidase n=1 Tax=Paenibacillus sp. SYP-B3998 TaxID=2678564 RepID=A0A6G4A0N1_9BACL|nr:C40 family peptidase [Paenibacillus sp. SYP-B3998]NEW08023.1 C40 family peptidase [Paenibacillus sp. SYP-B3998]
MMKNQKKWYKKLVITALTLSIGLSAGVISAPHAAEAAVATSATSRANQAISIGKQYLGRPYQFGAQAGQTRTFDCSSFTQYVFKKIGVRLPRTSQQQSHVGSYVSRSSLRAGDLVFFSIPGKPGIVHHVGIYIGNGNMINTYGAGGVRITNINSGSWSSRYMTARRVL